MGGVRPAAHHRPRGEGPERPASRTPPGCPRDWTSSCGQWGRVYTRAHTRVLGAAAHILPPGDKDSHSHHPVCDHNTRVNAVHTRVHAHTCVHMHTRVHTHRPMPTLPPAATCILVTTVHTRIHAPPLGPDARAQACGPTAHAPVGGDRHGPPAQPLPQPLPGPPGGPRTPDSASPSAGGGAGVQAPPSPYTRPP